jgi:hypothetical protein
MLLAAICYVVITALLFHNLLPVLTTSLPSDLGDPLLNTSILAWNAKHLPLSAGWWNFPSFAPLSGVTAFTEHLLGAYPLTSPIVWETGNAVLAYNVLFLACFPLNGLATYVLVRELTGSAAGALVGGFARAQSLAVLGEYRVVNGYSGYSPPHHAPLRDALLRHRPQLFQPFRERADLYVIVRPEVEPDFVDWLEAEQGIGRLPDVGDWRVYRLPREGSGTVAPMLPLPQPCQVALRVVGQ